MVAVVDAVVVVVVAVIVAVAVAVVIVFVIVSWLLLLQRNLGNVRSVKDLP